MKRGNAFESAVYGALSRCGHGGALLAAVSGGADSTAMLLAVSAVRERLGFALHCIHVDHGIRSEAECAADASAVLNLCDSLSVPCRIVSVGPGEIRSRARAEGSGVEAAARAYRHAAWKEEARRTGAHHVLVGHTADDLLETALIRFLRGAGPAGLSAMAEERSLVFRPLLSLSRADVLEYLAWKGAVFRTDSTNADPAYLRNRVRLHLVPLLDAEFPHWRGAVGSLARTQAEAAAFITSETAARIPWKVENEGDGALSTEEDGFFSQPDIVRQEALFTAVDRLIASSAGIRETIADKCGRRSTEPRRTAVRSFTAGNAGAVDFGSCRAARRGGRVVVERVPPADFERGFAVVVGGPGTYRAGPFLLRAVDAASFDDGPAEVSSFEQDTKRTEGEGFFARRPTVFRPAAAQDRIVVEGRSVQPLPESESGEASRADVVVAEDSLGIAAVLFIGRNKEKKVLVDDRRNGNADYAQSVFFSILL